MEGEPRVTARATVRSRSRAQATLEFAVVAPLFLLCFLASVDAGLWAVQNSAEVAAVESAARDAASAGLDPLAQTAPDAATVTASVRDRLLRGLFATNVVPWCGRGAAGRCAAVPCPASPAEVEAAFGPRTVAICVQEHDPVPCSGRPGERAVPYCDDSPTVTVRLIGFVAALVPPGLGPGESGGELPADVSATTHTLRFAA